jgi:predicted nucleotide-binding protein (sugar kinase/HSP70/actin superfamily)
MRLLYGTRPREAEKGSARKLYDAWVRRCDGNVRRGSWSVFKEDLKQMVKDFAALPVASTHRPKVGIVGEILVKYHAGANDRLIDLIEAEGGEAVVPDLASFLLACVFNLGSRDRSAGTLSRLLARFGVSALEAMRAPMREALAGTRFEPVHDLRGLARQNLVSPANQGGEGWLLAAEILRLISGGVKNVLCVQPFACLPNHITGKGVVKELKRLYRDVNILALDYDASVSGVNQLNRIKLLMASAAV